LDGPPGRPGFQRIEKPVANQGYNVVFQSSAGTGIAGRGAPLA
jgi:hypothetical protein